MSFLGQVGLVDPPTSGIEGNGMYLGQFTMVNGASFLKQKLQLDNVTNTADINKPMSAALTESVNGILSFVNLYSGTSSFGGSVSLTTDMVLMNSTVISGLTVGKQHLFDSVTSFYTSQDVQVILTLQMDNIPVATRIVYGQNIHMLFSWKVIVTPTATSHTFNIVANTSSGLVPITCDYNDYWEMVVYKIN